MNSAFRIIRILLFSVCFTAVPAIALDGQAKPCDTAVLSKIHIDSSGYISWAFYSKADTLNYRLEVFKWNKWVNVKSFQTVRGNSSDTAQVNFHTGTNRFRLRFEEPCAWVSPELVYENKKGKPCNWPIRVSDELVLDAAQSWNIYSSYGDWIMKGNDRIVSVKDLEKGHYYLIGDKQVIEFIRQ